MKTFILNVSLLGTLILCSPRVWSQVDKSLSTTQQSAITHEPAVEQLLDSYIKECKSNESLGFAGYRVQILSLTGSTAREEVLKARNKFIGEYSNFPAYMEYKSPSFRLMVGDCRTRSEALAIKNQIKSIYPNAFVVFDKIKYPQLITEDTQK
ncbi:MAG: SPOR domain-containing protein [Mangrovibacterium sp.]